MHLIELFNTVIKRADPDEHVKGEDFEKSMDIGGRKIVFASNSMDGKTWYIEFYEQGPNGKGATFKLTNRGNAIEVLAFVIDAIKHLIAVEDPSTIVFSATKADESRVSLYRKLVAKLANGFNVTENENDTDFIFILTRGEHDTAK